MMETTPAAALGAGPIGSDDWTCQRCAARSPAAVGRCLACKAYRADVQRHRLIAWLALLVAMVPGVPIIVLPDGSFGPIVGPVLWSVFVVAIAVAGYAAVRVSRAIGSWWWI